MSIPGQMVLVKQVPTMNKPVTLPVHLDHDSGMVGAYRLDLDQVGQLQVALDKVVEGIRAYQERRAGDA